MQTTNLTLNDEAYKAFDLSETTSKMRISEVFSEKHRYLNGFTLFIAHFNNIPNSIYEEDIDYKKANGWLIDNYSSEIKRHYYNKEFDNQHKKGDPDEVFYFLYEDLIICFYVNTSIIRFLFQRTPD
ncbi:hypothetical protein FW774_17065 [Pedobacter sp. BS3]|uniref:hypothetical protein n=1 Tax=Pedobacter sp. BS3 TaxID=2567937 RepID=UPI0011F039ED|nr:hypothetical protein [Pedobacter sp. BS3]TZF81767.1 hypothetical protein FW774_17065 [Pedobacter sp. BS3]